MFAIAFMFASADIFKLQADEVLASENTKEGTKDGKKKGKRGKKGKKCSIEERFKKVDSNSDGWISMDELKNRPKKEKRAKREISDERKAEFSKRVEAAFAKADADNNGGLDLEELKELRKTHCSKRKDRRQERRKSKKD